MQTVPGKQRAQKYFKKTQGGPPEITCTPHLVSSIGMCISSYDENYTAMASVISFLDFSSKKRKTMNEMKPGLFLGSEKAATYSRLQKYSTTQKYELLTSGRPNRTNRKGAEAQE